MEERTCGSRPSNQEEVHPGLQLIAHHNYGVVDGSAVEQVATTACIDSKGETKSSSLPKGGRLGHPNFKNVPTKPGPPVQNFEKHTQDSPPSIFGERPQPSKDGRLGHQSSEASGRTVLRLRTRHPTFSLLLLKFDVTVELNEERHDPGYRRFFSERKSSGTSCSPLCPTSYDVRYLGIACVLTSRASNSSERHCDRGEIRSGYRCCTSFKRAKSTHHREREVIR